MRILLIASAYNSMTQRVHAELIDRWPEVSVELAPGDEARSATPGAPAGPDDRVGQAAARQRAQDSNQELSLTRGMSAEVMEHLHRHPVITLSTASFTGMPHADTVIYTSDSNSIFFFAGEGTQLLRNINDSRRVSFTIDDYTTDWRKLRELQGVGRCLPATAAQHAAAWPLYLAKFGPGSARPPGLMHAIVPSEMHFVDHDHAVVTRPLAPIRRTFQTGDARAPGTRCGTGPSGSH